MKNTSLIKLMLLGLVTLLIYGNCYKLKSPAPKNPTLPEATESGKNTFGCLIDGDVYQKKGYVQVVLIIPSRVRGLSAYYNMPTDTSFKKYQLQVSSSMIYTKGIDKSMNFFIESDQPFKTGVPYVAGMVNGDNSSNAYYYDNSSKDYMSFNTDEQHQLTVTFTRFDASNRIAAGTFSGSMISNISEAATDTIEITEGRFDVKFTTN